LDAFIERRELILAIVIRAGQAASKCPPLHTESLAMRRMNKKLPLLLTGISQWHISEN